MPRKGQKMNPFSTAASQVTRRHGKYGWFDSDINWEKLQDSLEESSEDKDENKEEEGDEDE